MSRCMAINPGYGSHACWLPSGHTGPHQSEPAVWVNDDVREAFWLMVGAMDLTPFHDAGPRDCPETEAKLMAIAVVARALGIEVTT
jgi:hypothetical protein